jgi:uncharacterized protein YxeA
MIKLIVTVILIILALIGGLYLFGSFDSDNTSELLENEDSPLNNIPESEFSNLETDDDVLLEIDSAVDELG